MAIKTHIYVFLLLTLLIFLLYGKTISHGYAIDDNLVTENHSLVSQGLKAIPQIFTSYYFADKKMQFGYRPVTISSFAIEHEFFGQNPHVSHFINLILYLLGCFLAYFILLKVFRFKNLLFPLLVTVLFVTHPIHTEVVCSIKSRDELLSFIFSFSALWAALSYTENKNWYKLPLITFLLVMAVFSKQTAYTFLAIIPLSLFIFQKKFCFKTQTTVFIFLFAGIVLASIPRFILPPVEREIFYFENPLAVEGSIIQRFNVAMYVILFYFKLLVIPHPLVFYYGYNMIPLLPVYHPWVILGFVSSLALFAWALLKIRKYPLAAFTILYFFITLSMFLNIVEPVAGIVAERFIYFSSLSYCILMTLILFGLFKSNPFEEKTNRNKARNIILASLLVVVPYAVKTSVRSGQWKNYSALYAHDIKYLDNSALAHAIYAETLINEIFQEASQGKQPTDFEKKRELALNHYLQSIKVYPDYFSSYNNTAFIYYQLYNDYNSAVPYLQKAISLRPDYTEAYFNLGYCYQMLNQLQNAESYYLQALSVDPAFLQAYSQLGEVYLLQNDLNKAVAMNEKIKSIAPASDLSYINLGKIYLSAGDTVQSMLNFEKAAELSPDNIELLKNLAAFYDYRGNKEKASYYYSLLEKRRVK
ncbi:MAG: photosystem I assembly protein Ycf3 [Bacteroidetes bacterium ADurb.Bin408]|nr:MAG: photosystem I assembly protein Ycf3 [Bacteroidetes bacterium ADurb.Bin408]